MLCIYYLCSSLLLLGASFRNLSLVYNFESEGTKSYCGETPVALNHEDSHKSSCVCRLLLDPGPQRLLWVSAHASISGARVVLPVASPLWQEPPSNFHPKCIHSASC